MAQTKNNSLKYFVTLVIAVFLGLIVGANYQNYFEHSQSQGLPSLSFRENEKLDRILKIVKSNYVDKVNTDSLQDLAIGDILNSLDPHSVYLPPQQAKNQSESLDGNFDGIGIGYFMINDTLFVTYVTPDGPSSKAGILRGDKIIAVDGAKLNVGKPETERSANQLRGKRGSKVVVTLIRLGKKQTQQVEITRDRITVSSIDVAFLAQPHIGYIKISKFGTHTDVDFADALTNLQKEGMQSLILDLRGNGGGYLNSATALADQFLANGQLILFTKGLHEPRTDYHATADGLFEKGKLMVLIDEGTASASEIVAGALQDLDRGTIIGRRSFGKGLVQEQFGFDDGSAINLTIARYYTPSGRSIQKSYSQGKAAYKAEINHRFKRGEYSSLDSALKDSVFSSYAHTYKTSKGKTVYGGGGIMPDIFIPLDTSALTPFYELLSNKALIPEYVYGKLVPKINIAVYPNVDDFVNNYHFNEDDFKKFLAFCSTKKLSINKADANLSKPLIIKEIKALLASYYFRADGFYKVFNQQDDFVIKAIAVIKKPT